MRARIFIGAFLLVSVLAAGTVATSSNRIAPARQSAIAYLPEPTWIGSTMVQGSVRFSHDETRMKGSGNAVLKPLPTPIPTPHGVTFINPDDVLPTAR